MERDRKSSLGLGEVLKESNGKVVASDAESRFFVGIVACSGDSVCAHLLLLRREMEVTDDGSPKILEVAGLRIPEIEWLATIYVQGLLFVEGREVTARLSPTAYTNIPLGVGFGWGRSEGWKGTAGTIR